MSFLLDSNACIAMFRGNLAMRQAVDQRNPDDIFLCVPVIAELYVGALLSKKRRENTQLIEELMRDYDCLSFSARESLRYARVVTDMAAQGLSGTAFDMQIAAIALTHDLTVVTDDGNFAKVPDLPTENWLSAKATS